MNVKSISRTVGLILLITGIFQLFPLLIAVIDHEPRNILAYIESLCLILLVGSALLLFSRGGNRMFSAQEALPQRVFLGFSCLRSAHCRSF